jgi:hypothetical protein
MARCVGVGIAEAGHYEMPGRVDLIGAGGRGETGAYRSDAIAFDQDVGPREGRG